MHKTLICAGFHRSATSATASYLYHAGLNMGYELMGNTVGNVRGHYEDWPAVRLHDEQLANAGTSWQFHDEVALHSHSRFLDEYIELRHSKNTHWGVKDPRACLFLPQWQQALGENGYFLLVLRHWSSCLESLLHRESRDLAHNLYPAVAASFWQQPELAAKMWLAYNRRLLSFAKQHRARCLIATQRGLFQGAPLIDTLNERFGFRLDTSTVSPFDQTLLRDKACVSVKESLSFSLQAELEAVWQQLLALTDFRAEEEAPIYYPAASLSETFVGSYQSACKQQAEHDGVQNEQNTFQQPADISELSQLDEDSLLAKIAGQAFTPTIAHSLEQLLQQRFPLSGKLYAELAKLYQQDGAYQKAIEHYSHAKLLGFYFPFVSMQIGLCYQALGADTQAQHFLDKALEENPNNPHFYISKARWHMAKAEPEAALTVYHHAIEQLGPQIPLIQHYVECLLSQQQIEQAQVILNQADQSHPAIMAQQSRISLLNDVQAGLDDYLQSVAMKLADKDRFAWLASVTHTIPTAAAESDLLIRCEQHWHPVFEQC